MKVMYDGPYSVTVMVPLDGAVLVCRWVVFLLILFSKECCAVYQEVAARSKIDHSRGTAKSGVSNGVEKVSEGEMESCRRAARQPGSKPEL